jgi:hypothetical protein
MQPTHSRRTFVQSGIFGLLAVGVPNLQYAHSQMQRKGSFQGDAQTDPRYPAIPEELVKELVGASHFNLDRVKEIVEPRPELARATWDWAFGDWETALGAASHVGRRDIANYLIGKGARPDLFTFTMLGAYETVREMIDYWPGIQRIEGPHGISLLAHAEAGLRDEGLTAEERTRQERLIAYLRDLGDADPQIPHKPLLESEKNNFLGDYRYGANAKDGFSVRLNMRGLLSLGKIGNFGGALYHQGNYCFRYNGTPSVTVQFRLDGENIRGLIVEEPGLRLMAEKVIS